MDKCPSSLISKTWSRASSQTSLTQNSFPPFSPSSILLTHLSRITSAIRRCNLVGGTKMTTLIMYTVILQSLETLWCQLIIAKTRRIHLLTSISKKLLKLSVYINLKVKLTKSMSNLATIDNSKEVKWHKKRLERSWKPLQIKWTICFLKTGSRMKISPVWVISCQVRSKLITIWALSWSPSLYMISTQI